MAAPVGLWTEDAARGTEATAMFGEGITMQPQEQEEEKEEKEDEQQEEKSEEREPTPPPYVYDAGMQTDDAGNTTSQLESISMGRDLTPESVSRYLPTSPRAAPMDSQSKEMAEAEDNLLELLRVITDPQELSKKITRQIFNQHSATRGSGQYSMSILGANYDLQENPWYVALQDDLIKAVQRYHSLRNIRQGQTQNKRQRAVEDLDFNRRLKKALPQNRSVRQFLLSLANQGAQLGSMVERDNVVVQEGRPAMTLYDPNLAAGQDHWGRGGDFTTTLPEIPEIRQALANPLTGQARADLKQTDIDDLKQRLQSIASNTTFIADRISRDEITKDIAEALKGGIGMESLNRGPPLRQARIREDHFSPRDTAPAPAPDPADPAAPAAPPEPDQGQVQYVAAAAPGTIVLPYGGDIQQAAAAQDRDAIRTIMQHNRRSNQ